MSFKTQQLNCPAVIYHMIRHKAASGIEGGNFEHKKVAFKFKAGINNITTLTAKACTK
jgi:hypothetical protein